MPKPLPDRIEARLNELDLNPNAASVMMGKERSYVRNIIRGKSSTPQGKNLFALARVLQVSPEFFTPDFDGEVPPARPLTLSDLPDKVRELIADYLDLDDRDQESILEEAKHLAAAARARRQRGGQRRD